MYANTLSSGLDDYPRSSHPDSQERHVDLYSWIACGSRIMARVAKIIEYKEKEIYYLKLEKKLIDNLDFLHWDEKSNSYADFGLHINGQVRDWPIARCADMKQRKIVERPALSDDPESVCVPPLKYYGLSREESGKVKNMSVYGTNDVNNNPILQFVPRYGYVSIFPLILRVIPPDSPRLLVVMKMLRNEKHLWTPWGLRSLSKHDTFYGKSNAPGDDPYWRGPIWYNINYLALSGLYYYANTDGPFQTKANEIYHELRENVIMNIFGEWKRTGFFWEQYNDETGEGQKAHPFTGWTATVVNIMGELY